MVLWVFGYGSLIWNTGFEYDERVVGFVKNFKRVFNQASTDHRGTPEYPGRTVTLEPHEGGRTSGCAYKISGYEAEQLVLSYLAIREFEYDIQSFVDFYTEESPNKPVIAGVLVYIGSPDISKNPYYLGPAPLQDMANQIATARGPAGPNYEYLFRLEESLYEIGCEDNYIIALANEVRKVLNEYGWLLQDFEDVKLRQSLEDGKLLTTYEKSFDNRQLLQKCVRIVA